MLPGTVCQNANATMNYDNYERAAVLRFSVKLVGWPLDVITSPHKITNVSTLTALRTALRSGLCHWVHLSKAEVKKYEKDLEERKAAGEVIGKKRKDRSDRDVVRGPRKSKKNDTDEQPPQKKQKAASNKDKQQSQLPPLKSREIIEDSDSESS